MTAWSYEGTETEGIIFGGGERYPCRLEHGQVQVVLPFTVDQQRLRSLLQQDGWAVAQDIETADAQGWGPSYVMDGYYPYWLRAAPAEGGDIFAFPPQEFRMGTGASGPIADTETAAHLADASALAAQAHQSADTEATEQKTPVIASRTLEQFARWLPYLKGAAVV